MPDISAYSQPYAGRNETADYNFDLISKVMQNKQNEFDSSLRNLQALKSQSLNIRFINQQRQGQIDDYNKQLNDKFSNLNGEYGDLSDAKNYNNYLSWFDNIAKDTDLINAYQTDKKWQNEITKKDGMKMAKDPAKAGYAALNESVFNSHLADYALSTKDKPFEFKGYVPYFDQVKETATLLKVLPKQEWQTEEIMANGYKRITKMSGYNEDQMRSVQEGLSANSRAQSNVEAEYLFMRNNKANPGAFRDSVKVQYETHESQLKADYQDKLKNVDVSLAREQDPTKSSTLQQYKIALQGKIEDIDKEIITPDGWHNMKDSDLLDRFSELHHNNKISAVAKGLASKESHIIEADTTYIANANIIQRGEIFKAGLAFKVGQANEENKIARANLVLKAEALQFKGMAQASKGLTANGDLLSAFGMPNLSPILDNKGNISTDVKKDTYSDIQAVQNQNSAKAFNLFDDKEWQGQKSADGNTYSPTVTWQGKPVNNNEMIKKFVSGSTDIASWNQFSSVLSTDPVLPNNASVQLLKQIMPKIIADPNYQSLNADAKVTYLKHEVNDLINLTPEMAAKYGEQGVAAHNVFNYTKQFEQTYNQKLGVEVKNSIRDLGHGNISWEQFAKEKPDEIKAAQQRIANGMMSSPGTAMLLGNQTWNFSDVAVKRPASGKIDVRTQAYMQYRQQIANVVKEQYGLNTNVPLDAITGATLKADGKMEVYFDDEILQKQKDSGALKDIDAQYSGPAIFGQHIKGLRTKVPLSIDVSKTVEQPNEVDKVVTAGGVSSTSLYQNGKLFKIDLYQSGDDNMIGYSINGKVQPAIYNQNHLFPRTILQGIIQNELPKL